MPYTLTVELARWSKDKTTSTSDKTSTVKIFTSPSEVVNGLRLYLGQNWYEDFFEESEMMGLDATHGYAYVKNENKITIAWPKQARPQKLLLNFTPTQELRASQAAIQTDAQTFATQLLKIHKAKTTYRRGNAFLWQVLNPFKWMRHGLTLASLAAAMGMVFAIGAPALLSHVTPTLIGIISLSVPIGLFTLLIYGAVEMAREYRAARQKMGRLVQTNQEGMSSYTVAKKKRRNLFKRIEKSLPSYKFGHYLYDLVSKWPSQHPAQAAVLVIGFGLFIVALMLTVPYCIDPTGTFSFMSTMFHPLVHFLHEGLALLVSVPHLGFFKYLQTPVVELAIMAGLFISATIAIPLTLKGWMQGADAMREPAYNEYYTDELDEPIYNTSYNKELKEKCRIEYNKLKQIDPEALRHQRIQKKNTQTQEVEKTQDQEEVQNDKNPNESIHSEQIADSEAVKEWYRELVMR